MPASQPIGWIVSLHLIFSPSLWAGDTQIQPPGQPAWGPGGSAYVYGATVRTGPFSSAPGRLSDSALYYIYQPSGDSLPASLPVILFLHGYLLSLDPRSGDSPSNYLSWIQHIVRKGYTVVFPLYDQDLGPHRFAARILASWEAALSRLSSGGFIPPRSDAQGMQTAFVGHSLGAVEALTVAQTLASEPMAVGVPRAIAAFTPGLGRSRLPVDFGHLDPNTKLILVEADEDTPEDLRAARMIWSGVTKALSPSNRDYLEVISDEHGTPAQLGNHWFPLTTGLNDNSPVDDRDYNVTWKLSVGLFDCVFSGADCSYVLTQGGEQEVEMGRWTDGTPVHPLEEIP